MIVRHQGINTGLSIQIPNFDQCVGTAWKQPFVFHVNVETHHVRGVALHDLFAGKRVVHVPLADAAVHAAGLHDVEVRVQFDGGDVGAVALDFLGLHGLDYVLIFVVVHFLFQHF